MWWEKRLLDPNFFALTVNPRVFALMSHQEQDPNRIVCKLLRTNFYTRGTRYNGLDPRGMFLIHSEKVLNIWIGNELPQVNLEAYLKAAKSFAELL